jgi:hypothetical protein
LLNLNFNVILQAINSDFYNQRKSLEFIHLNVGIHGRLNYIRLPGSASDSPVAEAFPSLSLRFHTFQLNLRFPGEDGDVVLELFLLPLLPSSVGEREVDDDSESDRTVLSVRNRLAAILPFVETTFVFIKSRKRWEYSAGPTADIKCYKTIKHKPKKHMRW